ncbi:MAG: glycine--tRNA ligase [Desulfurococcaceae archaeon]
MLEDQWDEFNKLLRNRGYLWPSYEIYGGVAGLYDFGPAGTLLKNNIIELWRKHFIYRQYGLVVEIETPMVTPQIVLKASGHEDHFTDPVVECLKCGRVYRADHLVEESTGIKVEGLSLREIESIINDKGVKCPIDGGELSAPKHALLLFKTEIGPYKGALGYIRPETAQGMFTSFKHVLAAIGERLPIGIAQIGKVGRNEISPRQGLVRLREFTIMELEFFFDQSKSSEESMEYLTDELLDVKLRVLYNDLKVAGVKEPVEAPLREFLNKGVIINPWLAYWMAVGQKFVESLGIPREAIYFEEKLPHERAHYSAQTFDQLVYSKRYGWIEVAGYAYRTDYDLRGHMTYSKADLTYFKKYEKPVEGISRKLVPDVVSIKRDFKESAPLVLSEVFKLSSDLLERSLEAHGYVEVGGIKLSKDYFIVREEKTLIHGEKIVPHVVEPSFGLERLMYVVLEHSFSKASDGRIVMKFQVELAPYKAAVFPLVTGRKEAHQKIKELAINIYRTLLNSSIPTYYDEEGSIGKRYVKSDEYGIPYAITVDYQSITDGTITIRFRDTRSQVRVSIDELKAVLSKLISTGAQ